VNPVSPSPACFHVKSVRGAGLFELGFLNKSNTSVFEGLVYFESYKKHRYLGDCFSGAMTGFET
jgi:hypothetical protein